MYYLWYLSITAEGGRVFTIDVDVIEHKLLLSITITLLGKRLSASKTYTTDNSDRIPNNDNHE